MGGAQSATKSDAVICHPTLLDKLGLEDFGDWNQKARARPDYPKGSGRTTRMKLHALMHLANGRRVMVVMATVNSARMIERELQGWCKKIGVQPFDGQLIVTGLRYSHRGDWEGVVIEDHYLPAVGDVIDMTIEEFEKKHDVNLTHKDKLLTMRIVGQILRVMPAYRNGEFMSDMWTTYRWPWQKRPTIGFDTTCDNPMAEDLEWLRDHELGHAADMRTLAQLVWQFLLFTLIPLPVFLSGRWFIERDKYLGDIKAGVRDVDNAVQALWDGYGWPWPRTWMSSWFNKKLKQS